MPGLPIVLKFLPPDDDGVSLRLLFSYSNSAILFLNEAGSFMLISFYKNPTEPTPVPTPPTKLPDPKFPTAPL